MVLFISALGFPAPGNVSTAIGIPDGLRSAIFDERVPAVGANCLVACNTVIAFAPPTSHGTQLVLSPREKGDVEVFLRPCNGTVILGVLAAFRGISGLTASISAPYKGIAERVIVFRIAVTKPKQHACPFPPDASSKSAKRTVVGTPFTLHPPTIIRPYGLAQRPPFFNVVAANKGFVLLSAGSSYKRVPAGLQAVV